MIPRSLEVLKYIQSQFTPQELEKYGNIVGSVSSSGWSNNYDTFYTEKLPNAYGTEPGDPAPDYYITGYDVNGAPLWNQNPKYVQVTDQSGKIVFLLALQANSPVEPPIGPLVPPVPPPPVKTYTIVSNPDTAFPGTTVISTVTSSDPNDSATLFWKYTGTGLTPSYINGGALSGQFTLVNGTSRIISTIAWPVANPITINANIYTNSDYSTLLTRSKITVKQSSYTLAVDQSAIGAGETFTSTVTTQNVPNGSTLYYRYTNVPADYIVEGLEGQFTVTGSIGTFTSTAAANIPSPDTLTITIYQDAARKQAVGNTVTVRIAGTVSYSLTTYPTSISETKQVVNTVATTNVANDTVIYWKYEAPVDLSTYFLGNEVEGQATVTSNRAVWSSITAPTVPADTTVTVKLFSDAARTVQVGNETTFDITKTLLPTYDLQSNPKELVANSLLTNAVTTQNVGDTTLYWEYSGDTLTPSFFTDGNLDGQVTVTNDAGQWQSTLTDPVPADEVMTISLYEDVTKAELLSSQTVNIRRTLVPTYSVSVSPGLVTDGKTFTSVVQTTDVPNDTVLYWDYTGDGLSGAWFDGGVLSGQVTINNNSATWTGKTSNPVPSGINVSINLYTDAQRTVKVAAANLQIKKTSVIVYSWSATPTSLAEGSTFTFTITASEAPTINEIFYYRFTGITADYLDPSSPGLLGTFTFPANQTTYTTPEFKIANPVPGTTPATIQAALYNDAGRTSQVGPILTLTVTPTPQPSYTLSVSPTPLLAGQTFTNSVSTVNVPQGTNLYWNYTGTNVDANFFKDGITEGFFVVDADGNGTWSSSLKNPVPSATTLFVNLYSDETRLKKVASKGVSISNPQATYSLDSDPTTVYTAETFTNTVTTTGVADNTTIYWKYDSVVGKTLSSSYFEDGRLSGSVQITDGSASWTSTVKTGVSDPNTSIAVQIFSDSIRNTQVGNQQLVDLIFDPVPAGYAVRTDFPVARIGKPVNFYLDLPSAATEATTFYWSLEGFEDGAPVFNTSEYSGDITVEAGGSFAQLTKTVRSDITYGEIGHIRFSLNQDGSSPVVLPQVVNISANNLDPGIYFNTLGASAGGAVSVTVYDPDPAKQGPNLFWVVDGIGITDQVVNPLSGNTVFASDGTATIYINVLGSTQMLEGRIKFFLGTQGSSVYNPDGYPIFIKNSEGSAPTLRSEISRDDYYNLGGFWEEVGGVAGPNNVGTNPDLNMAQVMESSSDIDTLVVRAHANYKGAGILLYNIDSLSNDNNGQFCISTELGAGWADDTGNEWSKGANFYSAGKAKNTLYHAKNTFKPNRLIVSIGGDENEGSTYVRENGDIVGGFHYVQSFSAAQLAANQAASLVKNCGADGLEISMWFDRNEIFSPNNYIDFFYTLRNVLSQLDPRYTLHLALNARPDDGGPPATSNQPDFAGQLQGYFDSITIKNYNNPTKYGQVERAFGTPAAADFYHTSNLAWALREAKAYNTAGVPIDKIGYTVSGTAAQTSTSPTSPIYTSYNRVLRSVNNIKGSSYDGPLGRFFGPVTPIGSAPENGTWAFDSPSVVSQKVQSAINLGMSHLSLWNFSGDYYDANDTTLAVIASAARSHNGLVSATRKALSADTYGTSIIINNRPTAVRESETLTLEAYEDAGYGRYKTYWFQFEEFDSGLGQWKAISSEYFVGGVTKGSFQLDENGRWTQNYTTAVGPFPTDSLDVRVALYSSEPASPVPVTTKPLSTSGFDLIKTPIPTVTITCQPTSVNDGGEFTTTFVGTNLNPGDYIWWDLKGVSAGFFAGGQTEGTVQLDEGLTATLETRMAAVLPNSGVIEVEAALSSIAPPVAKALVNAYKITPDTPEVGWTASNPWARPGTNLTFTIEGKPNTTYYWRFTGFNSSDFLSGSPNLESSSTTDSDGIAVIVFTVNLSLQAGCVYLASLYEDAGRTKRVCPSLSGTILQTWANVEPFVVISPPAANVNQTITYTIYDPDASDGDPVYVEATGNAVDNNVIVQPTSKTLAFNNKFAKWEIDTTSDFPSLSSFYELKVDAYIQQGGSPYKNAATQYVFLHEAPTIETPTTGSYVFMRDWFKDGQEGDIPGHPPANQAQIKQYGFPQIDEFYCVGETRVGPDGKLYHALTANYIPENLVLTADGTGWNQQGLDHGGDPLKLMMEQVNGDPKPNSLVISVGGPAGWGDDIPAAGASDATAETLADQLFSLATLCEASAIDLMYQPDPIVEYQTDNFVRVFSKLRNKVFMSNSSMKIYFTTHPIRGASEEDKKILETAYAIKDYVDRINVLTLEHYSQLGQDYWDQQGKPGGDIFAHTGVWQSTKDVSLFIGAGVPASKLGMAYAYYGHGAIVDTEFDQSYKSDYNDIAFIQGVGDFPLGRYSTNINGEEIPVSFDSTTTIAQKIQALRNMGVSHIFGSEITKDYFASNLLNPGGNSRVALALTRAAKIAAQGFENPISP